MDLARATIRSFLHQCWLKRLWRGLRDFIRDNSKDIVDREANRAAARDCLTRASRSDWWEWSDGSRLHFWRWPRDLWYETRDGRVCYWESAAAPSLSCPKMVAEPKVQDMMNRKIQKFLDRRYIVPGPVTHLTFLFWVAKGDDDIRIVWDSSGNGVNATIWTPSFGIPSVRTLTCYIIAGTHMGDFDIGECWHNFFVHLRDRGLFGVELPTELQKIWGRRWFRWERLPMGARPSPYNACRLIARALEYAVGRPFDETSAFRFDTVDLSPSISGHTGC